MDECREAFEAVIKQIYGNEYVDLERDETGEYISLIPEVSYKVWQAARNNPNKHSDTPRTENATSAHDTRTQNLDKN